MAIYHWFVSWLLARRCEWVAIQERVEAGAGPFRRGDVIADGRQRVPIDGLSNGRRERIAQRVALLITVLTTLGFVGWYAVAGSIPATNILCLPILGTVSAPFALPYWFYAPLVGVWSYVLLSTTGLRFHWKQLVTALPVLAISAVLFWVLALPIVAVIFLLGVSVLGLFNVAVCRGCTESCLVPSVGRVLRYGIVGALLLLPGIGPAFMLPIGAVWAGYRLYCFKVATEK